MVDINGRTIEVGQRVAFSVMFGRSGTSHWISIGEVIDIKKTPQKRNVYSQDSCSWHQQLLWRFPVRL